MLFSFLTNTSLFSSANEPALTDSEQEQLENQRTDRSWFVQDLILSTLGSGTFRKCETSFSREAGSGLVDEFSQLLVSTCTSDAGATGDGGRDGIDVSPVPITITADSASELNQDIEIISLGMGEDDDKDDS